MNRYNDDFINGVLKAQCSEMLYSFIDFLGIKNQKVNFTGLYSAEVAAGDLTILLSIAIVDITHNEEGCFTVYDKDWLIQDQAYFKFDGDKWVEED